MNLRKASTSLRAIAFRISRAVIGAFSGGRICAFGLGDNRIESILVINLDRQPNRWKRVLRELSRFRTDDGVSLVSITRRLPAVDARDGRAVAATADVDTTYRMLDQLFVQPDARLAECFGADEPIRMTRQEVAVARSHIEAWKAIANGPDSHVLVLEDDVWFCRGAATAIDRGWSVAQKRLSGNRRPHLLYLSYRDAGGTAERVDVCDALFRPLRGFWFLSGYVLSREGAMALLRAMPVRGPVDLWINHRFTELDVFALASPAILQREDGPSDNSYSILPYLARAGIVDSGSGPMKPDRAPVGRILAWTARGQRENLAMALSMLGLRVRAFDGDEAEIDATELKRLVEVFDALVDAPLTDDAISVALRQKGTNFIMEPDVDCRALSTLLRLQPDRVMVLDERRGGRPWAQLCALLGLTEPVLSYPAGTPRRWRMFRNDRDDDTQQFISATTTQESLLDDSPWVLPENVAWIPREPSYREISPSDQCLLSAKLDSPHPAIRPLIETFPGNLASFEKNGLQYNPDGAVLTLSEFSDGTRPYRSGAFASARSFGHCRFEAEIKAARGSGLITGFFLHRECPRQEIDIELPGDNPRHMLVNVYFNPGDDGADMGFGYRGSPYRVDLNFDTTEDYHLYSIDWRPDAIIWSVDQRIVHQRASWDPTPIPHLPMRLHANLWAPRSEELAGRITAAGLPARARFKNISIRT